MKPMRYSLPTHVYACASPDGAVLLDIRHGRYVAIGGIESDAARHVVDNWPVSNPENVSQISVDEHFSIKVAETLIEAGLLDIGQSTQHRPFFKNVDLKDILSIYDKVVVDTPRITCLHLIRFTSSLVQAYARCHLFSFQRVVTQIHSCKKRAVAETASIADIAQLVAVFRLLRPYAFMPKGNCLFHSLTLLTFLAYYGHHPTWIIGVRIKPWGAHSWLQQDSLLLDCTPPQVLEFDPIMVI